MSQSPHIAERPLRASDHVEDAAKFAMNEPVAELALRLRLPISDSSFLNLLIEQSRELDCQPKTTKEKLDDVFCRQMEDREQEASVRHAIRARRAAQAKATRAAIAANA